MLAFYVLMTLTSFLKYGCPEVQPSTDNPNPSQQIPDGQAARFRRELF